MNDSSPSDFGAHALRERASRAAAGDGSAAIIGLGYVGLSMAAAFVAAGRSVVGFDSDGQRLSVLAAGESPVAHLDPRSWLAGPAGAALEPSADWERLSRAAAIYLCLPTPLDASGRPDLSAIRSAAQRLAPHLERGQCVVLCSTVAPGTTREVLGAELESELRRRGLELGRDVALAYSPEREDPGRTDPPIAAIPRLVGGLDASATERAMDELGCAFETLHAVASAEVAEAAKLFENVFRAVNIALVSEFQRSANAMGLDAKQVLDAAATKPFGFLPFQPGPGTGGHCIPIDPHYLACAARHAGSPVHLVELALDVNANQPGWIVERLTRELARRDVALVGARILVVGVAYKPDVSDCRESPALAILETLARRGAEVAYSDPLVASLAISEAPESLAELCSIAIDDAVVANFDAVLLATPHSSVDLAPLVRAARLVLDTRGRLQREMGASDRWVGP